MTLYWTPLLLQKFSNNFLCHICLSVHVLLLAKIYLLHWCLHQFHLHIVTTNTWKWLIRLQMPLLEPKEHAQSNLMKEVCYLLCQSWLRSNKHFCYSEIFEPSFLQGNPLMERFIESLFYTSYESFLEAAKI